MIMHSVVKIGKKERVMLTLCSAPDCTSGKQEEKRRQIFDDARPPREHTHTRKKKKQNELASTARTREPVHPLDIQNGLSTHRS